MVRLKDKVTRGSLVYFRSYFNSTMVRLKAGREYRNDSAIDEFQFHYGTIKRMLGVLQGIQSMVFQFHYGTIKRENGNRKTWICRISIPLWYD